MSSIIEWRSVVESFYEGVIQSSFVLRENPELIFPQIYNRVQWKAKQNVFLKESSVSPNKISKWNISLTEISRSGIQVIVWGVGSKGVSFLNTVKD